MPAPAAVSISPPGLAEDRRATAKGPADVDGAEADRARQTELLARLRAGEPAAFSELVREVGPRLLATARRYFTSEEDAQDAVQEAFMSAFKALPTFDGASKLSTWMHRIVVNACLMKLRSRRRRPERSIDDLLPKFDDSGHSVAYQVPWDDPPDGPECSRELAGVVRRCIDELPDAYREIILLRDIEGLDTEATAGLLGLTTNATKTRLHRARQALKTLLDPYMRGDDQ